MHAPDTLLQQGRVPGQVHIDDHRGCVLQVQPDTAGVSGKEKSAIWVRMELFYQRTTLVSRHAAAEQHMAPTTRQQAALDQLMGSQPLAENHRLGVWVFQKLFQQRHELVDFEAVVGLMVEQKSAVANHAHILQGAVHAALVSIRQITSLAPARDDAHDGLTILIVVPALLRQQGHKNPLVHALGQLQQYLCFSPSQHHGSQGLSDAV